MYALHISMTLYGEFLRNLDLILTRLENFGITLNPDKCKINLHEIKGVGYILDATGLRFSEDKLESVRIFPLYQSYIHFWD